MTEAVSDPIVVAGNGEIFLQNLTVRPERYLRATCIWIGKIAATVVERLCITRAAKSPSPVNSVALFRVRRHFNQARFDHHLLGRLVDLHQKFADIIDIAAGLAEEKSVSALIYLRRIF